MTGQTALARHMTPKEDDVTQEYSCVSCGLVFYRVADAGVCESAKPGMCLGCAVMYAAQNQRRTR